MVNALRFDPIGTHTSPGMNKTQKCNKNVSVETRVYGLYQETVINYLCETFLPIYREVSRQLYNNSMIATVRRSYHFYDQELGIYEHYIPTHLNGENIMQYCRIIVKVVPSLDPAKALELSRELRTPYTSPMGIKDSELIFLVAQKAVKDPYGKLPKGFKHGGYRNYMTYVICDRWPERAIKRIITLVLNHFKKRLDGLADDLNFPKWMTEWCIRRLRKSRKLDVLFTLGQRLSLAVMTLLNNLLGLTVYFVQKLKWIYREIGRQNVIKQSLSAINMLKYQLKGLGDAKIIECVGKLKTLLLQKMNNNNEGVVGKKGKATYIKANIEVRHVRTLVTPSQNSIYKENVNIDPYARFRDTPESLEKHEKAFLDYLDSLR